MKKTLGITVVVLVIFGCIMGLVEQRAVIKSARIEKLKMQDALLDAEHAKNEAVAEAKELKLKLELLDEKLTSIKSENFEHRVRLEAKFEERFSELDRRLDNLGSKEQRWQNEEKQLLVQGNERLHTMLATLKSVRFPPQPAGEKAVFEVAFGSVGPLKVKSGEPEHLALYLTWAKEMPKPDAKALKQIAALYRLNGANVTDNVLQLSPMGGDGIIGEAKEGDTSKSWFVAFKYGEGKTPIPFMNATVFPTRVHVLWYGGSGKPDVPTLEKLFREPLLDLAKSQGTAGGAGSEWNPDTASELVFKP